VYRAKYNQEIVALKQLVTAGKSNEDRERIYDEFRREVWVMSGLHHPCIVNLKGFSLGENLSMIMEIVSGGELYKCTQGTHNYPRLFSLPPYLADLNDHEKPVDWKLRMRIAWDIAKGMAYLHSASPPLLHRDLKSPNVLLSSHEWNAPVVAKIADFGLTGRAFTEFKAVVASERDVENPTWLAPEVMRSETYSTPADVYPYGVMLWELIARQHPYDEFKFAWTTDLEAAIKNGTRPTIPADCPQAYAELIKVCWANDPKDRPSFKTIVEALLPPVIQSLAPEIIPYIEKVKEQEVKMSTISEKSDQSRGASKKDEAPVPAINANFFAAVEMPQERIRRVAIVGRELWCCTEASSLLVFSLDGGRLVDAFPNLIPAAPVDIVGDVESDTIWVATRDGIWWFSSSEKSHTILGNLSSTFTVSEASKSKVKPIQKQCFFVDHRVMVMVVPREGTISKRSSSMTQLDERYDIDDISFVSSHPPPKAGAAASLIIRINTDGREFTFAGTQDQVDLWAAALQAAEAAKHDKRPLSGPTLKPFYKCKETEQILGMGSSGSNIVAMTSQPCILLMPFKQAECVNPSSVDLSKQFPQLRGQGLLPRATFVDGKQHIWLCVSTDVVLLSKPGAKIVDILRAHAAPIDSAARVKVSKTDREVWTLAVNGQLCFWDDKGKLLSRSTSDRPIYSIAALPAGPVALGNEHSIEIWSPSVRICEPSRPALFLISDPTVVYLFYAASNSRS
jgi:serine/threonine protein kinase